MYDPAPYELVASLINSDDDLGTASNRVRSFADALYREICRRYGNYAPDVPPPCQQHPEVQMLREELRHAEAAFVRRATREYPDNPGFVGFAKQIAGIL